MGGVEDKKLLGRWGEEQAAAFLKRKKYKITGLNYRCRFGEIDIIAENARYVVFVEVKLRRDARFAAAREFVNAAKQRRLICAAEQWLCANPTQKQPRFDVIEIYAAAGAVREINHIENAFDTDFMRAGREK
ncbi:MAG: YraN family protein [Oscillospiraceae bacterium]|nr:YraN family protein [Oscillospiraceae bacterium]